MTRIPNENVSKRKHGLIASKTEKQPKRLRSKGLLHRTLMMEKGISV